MIIFLKNKFFKKNSFIKNRSIVRITIFILTIIFFLSGSMYLIEILDPYSIFSRTITNIYKPAAVYISNYITGLLKTFKVYTPFHFKLHKITLELFLFSFSSFLIITTMTVFKNRWFCNTLCPAGTVLGILSKFSLFNFLLDKKSCIGCKKCEKTCKANCIDLTEKKIDLSCCVSCFNCISVCPNNSIKYTKNSLKLFDNTDPSKRNFLKNAFSIALFSQVIIFQKNNNKKQIPITPPGSESIKNFNEHCSSCHLCVSYCPTKVLSPTFMKYGLTGFMQPEMNYSVSYCDYECNKCSLVCPTGAIKKIKVQDKKLTQIGTVELTDDKCIVYRDNMDCGACAEHCPTKAVYMKPYKNIYGPVTNNSVCIGCGACEHACPSKPEKAIVVKSNHVHKKVDKNAVQEDEKIEKKEKPQTKKNEDFPF